MDGSRTITTQAGHRGPIALARLGALAMLIAGTSLAVGWSVSVWAVPPYLLLMAWLLAPSAGEPPPGPMGGPVVEDLAPESPSDGEDEPDPPSGSGSDPDGSATTAEAAPPKPRRGRGRGRSRAKAAPEPTRVRWVRVGPGQFVRVEEPAPSADGPHPTEPHQAAPVVPDEEREPTRSADPGPLTATEEAEVGPDLPTEAPEDRAEGREEAPRPVPPSTSAGPTTTEPEAPEPVEPAEPELGACGRDPSHPDESDSGAEATSEPVAGPNCADGTPSAIEDDRAGAVQGLLCEQPGDGSIAARVAAENPAPGTEPTPADEAGDRDEAEDGVADASRDVPIAGEGGGEFAPPERDPSSFTDPPTVSERLPLLPGAGRGEGPEPSGEHPHPGPQSGGEEIRHPRQASECGADRLDDAPDPARPVEDVPDDLADQPGCGPDLADEGELSPSPWESPAPPMVVPQVAATTPASTLDEPPAGLVEARPPLVLGGEGADVVGGADDPAPGASAPVVEPEVMEEAVGPDLGPGDATGGHGIAPDASRAGRPDGIVSIPTEIPETAPILEPPSSAGSSAPETAATPHAQEGRTGSRRRGLLMLGRLATTRETRTGRPRRSVRRSPSVRVRPRRESWPTRRRGRWTLSRAPPDAPRSSGTVRSPRGPVRGG